MQLKNLVNLVEILLAQVHLVLTQEALQEQSQVQPLVRLTLEAHLTQTLLQLALVVHLTQPQVLLALEVRQIHRHLEVIQRIVLIRLILIRQQVIMLL